MNARRDVAEVVDSLSDPLPNADARQAPPGTQTEEKRTAATDAEEQRKGKVKAVQEKDSHVVKREEANTEEEATEETKEGEKHEKKKEKKSGEKEDKAAKRELSASKNEKMGADDKSGKETEKRVLESGAHPADALAGPKSDFRSSPKVSGRKEKKRGDSSVQASPALGPRERKRGDGSVLSTPTLGPRERKGDGSLLSTPVLGPRTPARKERKKLLQPRPTHGQIRVKKADVPSNEHALETYWRFWFYDRKQGPVDPHRDLSLAGFPESTRVYASRLRAFDCFFTIEGFYRYWRCFTRASDLPGEWLLQLFRKGCWPLWECFPTGGCWELRVKKAGQAARTVESVWETLVLACIGEAFEMPEVVGVVLQSKLKEFVVSLWTEGGHNPEAQRRVGDKLAQLCASKGNVAFQYKDFQTVLRSCDGKASPNLRPASAVTSPLLFALASPSLSFARLPAGSSFPAALSTPSPSAFSLTASVASTVPAACASKKEKEKEPKHDQKKGAKAEKKDAKCDKADAKTEKADAKAEKVDAKSEKADGKAEDAAEDKKTEEKEK